MSSPGGVPIVLSTGMCACGVFGMCGPSDVPVAQK